MIPVYDVNNLTGNLDEVFQNLMRISFGISIVILAIFLIVSLLVWLFRSQEKIRKSNKIWNKKFYYKFNFDCIYRSCANIGKCIHAKLIQMILF